MISHSNAGFFCRYWLTCYGLSGNKRYVPYIPTFLYFHSACDHHTNRFQKQLDNRSLLVHVADIDQSYYLLFVPERLKKTVSLQTTYKSHISFLLFDVPIDLSYLLSFQYFI